MVGMFTVRQGTSRKDTRANSHDGPDIPATRECVFPSFCIIFRAFPEIVQPHLWPVFSQRIDFAPFWKNAGDGLLALRRAPDQLWRIFPR